MVVSPQYRRYLLALLALIFAFSSADRIALGVVLQNIEVDLGLSDTQLGFITGIGFALFYSLMGVPIARWADRGNRVVLIAVTMGLWGVAMLISSAVRSFTQLTLIRVCVAVGEAGTLPSALSLISDHFSRAERARAVGLYLQGGSLSLVIGYFLAGWLNQFYGWRWTFVMIGVPGFVLAVLAGFTLREPRREDLLKPSTADADPETASLTPGGNTAAPSARVGLKEVWDALSSNRTFRSLLCFYSLSFFFNCAIAQWQPTFLIRSYGLKTGELGTWTALACALGMAAGTYLGGEWASRRAAHNETLQLKTMAGAYCVVGVVSALIYLAPNRYCAFALMGLWNVSGAFAAAPLFATIQTLVPERMRATATTFVMLLANLLGAGLGPLAAGGLSDLLRSVAGTDSLRFALLALSPGYAWAGWYLWRASKTILDDLEALDDTPSHDRHSGLQIDSRLT